MKKDLCINIGECYRRGWITPKDGNVSLKPAESRYYYITPGGVNKTNLKEDAILKIDLYTNEILENKYNLNPSGEIILHNNLLKDDNYKFQNTCIIHCHPPYILAFIGILKYNRELNQIRKYFPEINEDIKIGPNVPYIQARTQLLGDITYNNLLNNSIVALKQHGIVCIAESFDECIEIIETIEYYCRIVLMER